jgi:hypothetical protein
MEVTTAVRERQDKNPNSIRAITNRVASAVFEHRAKNEIGLFPSGPEKSREAALVGLGRGLALRRSALVTAFRSKDRELVVRRSRILMEAYETAADSLWSYGYSILPNSGKAIETRAESLAKSADFYGKAAKIADNLGLSENFFVYLRLQAEVLKKTANAYITRGPGFTGKAIGYMEKAIVVAKKGWWDLPDPRDIPSHIVSNVEEMETVLKGYRKRLDASAIQKA